MSLFLLTAAIGLALSGGAAYAWWGDKDKAEIVAEEVQYPPQVGGRGCLMRGSAPASFVGVIRL